MCSYLVFLVHEKGSCRLKITVLPILGIGIYGYYSTEYISYMPRSSFLPILPSLILAVFILEFCTFVSAQNWQGAMANESFMMCQSRALYLYTR